MVKLIKGIIDFRKRIQPTYKETFAKLALEQKPETLLIACSDSRVVPNLFASTEPGDLFVLRNVGNIVAPCGDHGHSTADESEPAAIEFALGVLNVKDIIVCGHSECGAMKALVDGRETLGASNLKLWLRHGEYALDQLRDDPTLGDPRWTFHNRLSQLNVLHQLDNIKTYPIVADRIMKGTIRLHAWWFELSQAEVYNYNHEKGAFVVFDEAEADRVIRSLEEGNEEIARRGRGQA